MNLIMFVTVLRRERREMALPLGKAILLLIENHFIEIWISEQLKPTGARIRTTKMCMSVAAP